MYFCYVKTNKKQHTKKAILEALEKSLGVVTTACKKVSINRSTFYKYLKEDQEFAKQVKDIENIALDDNQVKSTIIEWTPPRKLSKNVIDNSTTLSDQTKDSKSIKVEQEVEKQ